MHKVNNLKLSYTKKITNIIRNIWDALQLRVLPSPAYNNSLVRT